MNEKSRKVGFLSMDSTFFVISGMDDDGGNVVFTMRKVVKIHNYNTKLQQ